MKIYAVGSWDNCIFYFLRPLKTRFCHVPLIRFKRSQGLGQVEEMNEKDTFLRESVKTANQSRRSGMRKVFCGAKMW